MHNSNASVNASAAGRACVWMGLAAVLLGTVIFAVQLLGFKRLFVPWYLPALMSVGAILLGVSLLQRRSIVRLVALLLVGALAGFEWYFFASVSRLPEYAGSGQAGTKIPDFQTALADGRSFSAGDLRDGRATVLTFYRGRW